MGAVTTGLWGAWTLEGEDARTIAVAFVVLGALGGSIVGALCGTLSAVVHQAAQRLGTGGAWWVTAATALTTAAVTFGGFSLWPVFFGGTVPVAQRAACVLVCASVAAWQVRGLQTASSGPVPRAG